MSTSRRFPLWLHLMIGVIRDCCRSDRSRHLLLHYLHQAARGGESRIVVILAWCTLVEVRTKACGIASREVRCMIILYVPHRQRNGVGVDMPEPRNVLGARRPELDFPMFQLCIKNIQPCSIVINRIDIHDATAIAVA